MLVFPQFENSSLLTFRDDTFPRREREWHSCTMNEQKQYVLEMRAHADRTYHVINFYVIANHFRLPSDTLYLVAEKYIPSSYSPLRRREVLDHWVP